MFGTDTTPIHVIIFNYSNFSNYYWCQCRVWGTCLCFCFIVTRQFRLKVCLLAIDQDQYDTNTLFHFLNFLLLSTCQTVIHRLQEI
jgi:hypothetical protein